MELKDTKEILICDCHSTEHQVVVYYSEDQFDDGMTYPMVYFHIHLNKLKFWERVKYAIKYIFGHQSRYGAFEEFIINPEDAEKLQNVVDYLKIKKS